VSVSILVSIVGICFDGLISIEAYSECADFDVYIHF
jgi:hypothetical protein